MPFLWSFLFGSLYYAAKGVWGHFLLSLLLAGLTAGISWVIYPFFTEKIMRAHYLRKGWIEVNK